MANEKTLVEQQSLVAPKKNEVEVVYDVAGQQITLTPQIVREQLTRGNTKASDNDVYLFLCMCKYNNLNPFLGEAYLVKFGSEPAQMVMSKEAVMKRAEANPNYQGFKAGIIIQREKAVVYEEGEFCLPTDVLLGGWAEVYRKDRTYPIVSRVCLSEYDKKQALWNSKKHTMIRKVALSHALREAFPVQVGCAYISEDTDEEVAVEESSVVEIPREVVPVNELDVQEIKEEPEPDAETEVNQDEPEVQMNSKLPGF